VEGDGRSRPIYDPAPPLRRLLCTLAVALWAVFPAAAQPTGRITGSVEDTTSAPLANVTITLQGAADRVAQTGPDGRFAFESLPEGEYELAAERDGYLRAERRVRLPIGTVDVVFTLWVHGFENVVVTAAKTGEDDALTTPIAVSVLSGTELSRGAAQNIHDIAGSAPSLTFSQNTGFGQLTIRGIGTNVVFAGSDPSTAVYLDGVYLARPAMVLGDFLDVERIEVLRGPQGTLYGRNAVGGAMSVITKPPTNELEASARLIAGNHEALRAEGRLSGPLVPGRLVGSAAFLRGVRQGFVRDLNHPEKPLGGEDVAAARGKLHFLFNAQSSLLLSGDVIHQDPTPLTYSKVLAEKPGFQVDNPADLHEVRTSTPGESRNVQFGGSARFTVGLGRETTLTSLTAFRKLDYDVLVDSDISELDLAESHIHEIQHQWSEEVTVSGRRPGRTWVAGLFLLKDVDRQPTSIRLGGPGLENYLGPEVSATTGALFGQGTFGVTRRVSATVGLRYTRERKTIENAGGFYTLEPPVVLLPGSYAYTDTLSHTAWTPKIGLEIQAGERTLAYVSATRGFKSGGFNVSSPEAGRGYAPEWAWSYEGGLKARLAGGRATFQAAGFLTDYTDLQVQTAIRPGVLDISNAAAATIRGVELEGTVQVAPALQIGGHVAWLDATYDRYVATGTAGVAVDVAGNRLANAPEWSGRLWLGWSVVAGRLGTLSLRVDSRWQTTVFFTPFNDLVQRQRPYGLLDVSLELEREHWSVGAYARNLTNEDYITGSASSPPPAIGGRPGDSRRIGVQLVVRR
jgi:iron complex outermembrane receptor protein